MGPVTDGDDGYEVVDDGDTIWRVERSFLQSNWTCIWGRGCPGIGPEPAPELQLGCCSLGAELDGPDEARNIAALAATMPPTLFQHHAVAVAGGIFADESSAATRVVDGACIFLNRPGFAGGAGCSLHLAALAGDEPPMEWKPSVCWQLPVHVDWEMGDGDVETATVRRWAGGDWGDDADTLGWCCTHEPEAYVGDERVIDSLRPELTAIVGVPVFVELRRRLG